MYRCFDVEFEFIKDACRVGCARSLDVISANKGDTKHKQGRVRLGSTYMQTQRYNSKNYEAKNYEARTMKL